MKKLMIVATAAAAVLAVQGVRAQNTVVDVLVTSGSGIEGVKNATSTTYYQGFDVTSGNAGNFSSITLDLSVAASSSTFLPLNPTGSDTMSFYLYGANASGVPTGPALATIATGVTGSTIESGTSLGYG